MKVKEDESHIVERIVRLLALAEESGMEVGQILEDGWKTGRFPLEDVNDFCETCSLIEFMDEIPGGFLIYYAGGNEEIIHANKGLLRIFQCETIKEFRELTGNSFRGVVYSEDLEAVEESIKEQILRNKYKLDYVEYRIQRKDGTLRWVEDYGHFVHGKSVGDVFYVFIGETTDEKNEQQTEQRRLLSEALERANLAVKAKNTFLTHISHDMRTPLNAVLGFASLAKANLCDAASVKEYLEQIEVAGHQILDMISEVLYVSSLAGAAGPAEVECDICGIVREVYDFLMPQAEEKDISFTLDCRRISHNGIYTDENKLRQLILNLANNAVTYTQEGGKVSVVLEEKGELPDSHAVYRLVVADSGIGISEEFLEKMFEPFSREKSSTLSGVRGVGLGLTIAKSIVDMMHGSIQAESSVNKGTTFTVTLTFRVQPLADGMDEKNVIPNPSLRILLVEDNEINREIEAELLERMGFTVVLAEDGRIALNKMEQASSGDYDLIITDLQMPVMDGWEAAAAIRKLENPVLARIPIIALSANTLISDQQKTLDSGIDVFLPKPMDFTVLLDKIEKLTGWREN